MLQNITIRAVISSRRLFHTSICSLAGHSKWQNIKGTKEAADKKRGEVTSMLVCKIKKAVLLNGGCDPNSNRELAKLIETCQQRSISLDVVNRTIAKVKSDKENMKHVTILYTGADDLVLAFNLFVVNPDILRGTIKREIKKRSLYPHLASVNKPKCEQYFTEVGRIAVNLKDETTFTTLFDQCFELELEDINESDGKIIIECVPQKFETVQKFLEQKGYEIQYAEIDKDAVYFNKLSKSSQVNIDEFINAMMEKHEDIMDIFVNKE